jgi:hypothetical protein
MYKMRVSFEFQRPPECRAPVHRRPDSERDKVNLDSEGRIVLTLRVPEVQPGIGYFAVQNRVTASPELQLRR